MPLIEALLLLLLLSRIIGEISEYFGQPAMIGEIVAGILLGPSVLGAVRYTSEIQAIAELGILLLVFLAGMEMDMDALWKSFRGRGIWVGAAGFTFPMVLGILIGVAFRMNPTRALFIGLCIAITALPVSVRILMGLGKLQTETGQRIVSAAVLNDVTALLILGVILDVKRKGGAPGAAFASMGLALIKAVTFMAVVIRRRPGHQAIFPPTVHSVSKHREPVPGKPERERIHLCDCSCIRHGVCQSGAHGRSHHFCHATAAQTGVLADAGNESLTWAHKLRCSCAIEQTFPPGSFAGYKTSFYGSQKFHLAKRFLSTTKIRFLSATEILLL